MYLRVVVLVISIGLVYLVLDDDGAVPSNV